MLNLRGDDAQSGAEYSPIIVQYSEGVAKDGNRLHENGITIIGELKTANGSPIIASIDLLLTNQKGTNVLDFSIVTSAYKKDALQRYISENSILYIEPNKKENQ